MNRKYMVSGQRAKPFLEVDPTIAPTILIYQPDERLDIIDYYFKLNHIKPIYATQEDITQKLIALNYDIAILDYYLAPGDLNLLEIAQHNNINLPLIMLVDYDPGGCELNAFKLGATLFLYRPYNIEILIYQLKAIAKKCAKVIRELPHNDYTLHGYTLDLDNGYLIQNEEQYYIALAPIEAEIMKLMFIYYKEGGISRDILLNSLFGGDTAANRKNLAVRISKLRKKLKNTPFCISPYHSPPYNSIKLSIR